MMRRGLQSYTTRFLIFSHILECPHLVFSYSQIIRSALSQRPRLPSLQPGSRTLINTVLQRQLAANASCRYKGQEAAKEVSQELPLPQAHQYLN